LKASARQESFTKAAQELFVTQGAREICGMAEATSGDAAHLSKTALRTGPVTMVFANVF